MKKKITTFLATLLLMLVALPASAQLDELRLKTVIIGEAANTMTPDTQWYLVWNKRVYKTSGGGYWEDKGAGKQAYMSEGTGVINDEDYASEKAQFLVRFISTQEEGKYKIQFGTGNYMCITSDQPYTTADANSAAFFNVYNINGEDGHFGVNVWNMGSRIDQNGSGATMATWGSGEINYINGNNDFTFYPVTFDEGNELTYALEQLSACFESHNTTFDRGTEIGQYNCSEEVYNNFRAALERAQKIVLQEVSTPSVEEINALIQSIEDYYNTIVATLVPLTIADGNYRIVSALEWTNTERIETGEYDENDQPIYEEVETHPTKAMYATLEGKAMWANIDETDCRYLWQTTTDAETGLVQLMNIATDGILATCSQSTQATLDANSQTMMKFEFIQRTEDGKVVVAMKPSTGGGYAYLHCNGHSSGTGKASNIVGWTPDAPASNWILEPVSDEVVQELVQAYAPIKNHELLVSMFQELITETEEAIAQAKDDQYAIERTSLITDTLQFSSPWTDAQEGKLSNLLSNSTSTFWHSDWHAGSVANHTHYLQVALTEPIEGDIQCFVRRRDAQNDHVTVLGVFGTNDPGVLGETSDGYVATTEEGWTEIGSFNLPNASANQTAYSNVIQLPESYQFLRFYIDGTTNNRGYGHFAQFLLYSLSIDGNTQWSQMGSAAELIENALATANAVDQDEVTMEDYNNLKEALDAFKLVLVDPSALAAAINANKDVTEMIEIGDAPGFWSADSEVGEFATTIEEATAYLKGGAYTQAEVDAYTKAIKGGASDIFAAANPIEPGKWYAFKYDSKENFEAHLWGKDGAEDKTLGDLWDNYAAPANVVTEGEGAGQTSMLESFESLDGITIGQGVRFINEDLINEMDQVAFRFVAQGDTAFVIQHKSGLYLSGAARSTNLTLGLTPALFNVRAVGYGKVVIEARDLKGQGYYTEPVYLHAQKAGHSLVTWSNDNVASSSALYIEPIDESDLDEGEDVAEYVLMNAKPNSMTFICYPSGFSVGEGAQIYAYQGAFPNKETIGPNLPVRPQAYYAFNKIEQAEPGQPVLLVVGDLEDFEADDEEEEPEQIEITPVGTNFATAPLATNGVHGTYTYEWVDEGTVVVSGGEIAKPGNSLVLAEGAEGTDCTRDISANTGYIIYEENILKNASPDNFDLVIIGNKPSVKKTYNEAVIITVSDASDLSTKDIVVEDNENGTINFTIPNIVFNMSGVTINIAELTLPYINAWEGENGVTNFGGECKISIPAESLPNELQALALTGAFNNIPVTVNGKMDDKTFSANIDIDMQSLGIKPHIQIGASKGDVNLDGQVTIADAVSVLNAMAGEQVAGDADVNADGSVTIADFVTVLNIMAGVQ